MQKLSKKSILFRSLPLDFELIVPLIGLFVFAYRSIWGVGLLLALALFTLVAECLRWNFTLYELSDTEFKYYTGVFTKTRAIISHSRIQTVDITQSVTEKIFGLATCKIETPSGEETEVVLVGLRKEVAKELKRKLLDDKASIETSVMDNQRRVPIYSPSVERVKKIEPFELKLLALSSFSGAMTVAVIVFLWNIRDELDNLKKFSALNGFVERIESTFSGIDWLSQAVVIVGAMIVILLTWATSAIYTYLKFHRFQVTRLLSSILIERGFIETYQTSIQISKIQAVRIIETPLRQWLGWVSIMVECAAKDDENKEKAVIFPFVRKEKVEEFLEEFLPEFSYPAEMNLERFSSIPYKKTSWIKVLSSFAVVGGICYFWLPSWQWFAILGTLLSMGALCYSWIRYRDGGYILLQKALIHRRRGMNRVTEMVPYKSFQYKKLIYNPLYRKHDLVRWSTALLTGKSIDICYIPQEKADELMER
ncbi:PH domain-containing protein [Thermoactinomyces sp. DSM 45892]|uniref:PH domain-containing protein n=1 Tax=Thermoactinomyces sp. DSM 45892 TaxID=1882753 RepID=UPI000899FFB4|nr:PH domain-containing protein [Thermoactinomyces sp. DSM 45892]SDZ12742.1 Uncharacterized membrane protein YdbT, contains bPH2 (pleckstrin homology) domain [Thermoactinomyces sp. DSM 45892]